MYSVAAAAIAVTITASGTSAYLFSTAGSTFNPTLLFNASNTVVFTLSGLSIHPFYIKDNSGNLVTTGLVGTQGQTSGTLTWTVPAITSSFTYYCGNHAAMTGAIQVSGPATTALSSAASSSSTSTTSSSSTSTSTVLPSSSSTALGMYVKHSFVAVFFVLFSSSSFLFKFVKITYHF